MNKILLTPSFKKKKEKKKSERNVNKICCWQLHKKMGDGGSSGFLYLYSKSEGVKEQKTRTKLWPRGPTAQINDARKIATQPAYKVHC